MKKLISLVAVVAILASSVLCVFADTDVSTLVAGATELPKTGDAYEVEADSTGAYATIVAVKGTTIQVGAIQYINQAPTTSGKATFTFALNPDLVAAASSIADTKVYVITGGDGNRTVEGYIETATQSPEEPPVVNFAISGTVTGFAGSTLPTVVVTDGTNNYPALVNADGTFTVSVPELQEGSYTLTATKVSHLSYTKANITAETTNVNAKVLVGDVDATGRINDADIIYVAGVFDKNFGETGYVAAYDVDETGRINDADIIYVAGNFDNNAISE